MRKIRTKKYLQVLKNKAVKDYFNDPNQSLKTIAERHRISEPMLSNAISEKLSKKFKNSFSRKYM